MAKVLLPPMPVELQKARARKCILIDLESGKVTVRAQQVLNLLVTGSSNKQIPSQRNLSPDTFDKLGAWSRRNWLCT
jgi:DNA-binding NarL/FixJ family response regulator